MEKLFGEAITPAARHKHQTLHWCCCLTATCEASFFSVQLFSCSVLVQISAGAQTQLHHGGIKQPSGETLVRPKSPTSLAPPPLLPLANFSTIRSFDGGGSPLVGGASVRGAGRNPSGGGWGAVGGVEHPSIRQHLQRSLSRRSGLMANWEKGGTGQ